MVRSPIQLEGGGGGGIKLIYLRCKSTSPHIQTGRCEGRTNSRYKAEKLITRE